MSSNTESVATAKLKTPLQRTKDDPESIRKRFFENYQKFGPLSLLLLNHKGGVGKSMLARQLLMAIAAIGIPAVGADGDPQANLSRRLGFGPHPDNDGPPTLADAIKDNRPGIAEDVLTAAMWDGKPIDNLGLLPASYDLDNRESETGPPDATYRMFNTMNGAVDDFPVRIWDCRPSLGHLTQQSMVAAGRLSKRAYVLIVTEPEYDAMEGAARAHKFVYQYREYLRVPNLEVGGIVINKTRRTDLHESNIADLRETYGDLIWEPDLPLWTVMADAQNSAAPLSAYKDKSARELESRIDRIRNRALELGTHAHG